MKFMDYTCVCAQRGSIWAHLSLVLKGWKWTFPLLADPLGHSEGTHVRLSDQIWWRPF